MNPDYPSNEVLAKQYVAVIYSRGNFAPSHRQAQKRIVVAPVKIAEVYAQYGTVRGHVRGIGPETAFVLDDIFKRGVTRVQELYRGARDVGLKALFHHDETLRTTSGIEERVEKPF